jgi:hypothetical protein
MLNVIMLSVLMLSVFKLNVVMLNVLMLSVVKLNVVMLNVVAHIKQLKKLKKEVWKTSLTPQYMTFRGMEDRS